MFMHMLGYPTHFGQMECLKLISSTSYVEKVSFQHAIPMARHLSFNGNFRVQFRCLRASLRSSCVSVRFPTSFRAMHLGVVR